MPFSPADPSPQQSGWGFTNLNVLTSLLCSEPLSSFLVLSEFREVGPALIQLSSLLSRRFPLFAKLQPHWISSHFFMAQVTFHSRAVRDCPLCWNVFCPSPALPHVHLSDFSQACYLSLLLEYKLPEGRGPVCSAYHSIPST